VVPRTDFDVMGRHRVMLLGGRHVLMVGHCLGVGHRRVVSRAGAASGEHHPILEARCGRGERRDELMLTATRDRIACETQELMEFADHGCTSSGLRRELVIPLRSGGRSSATRGPVPLVRRGGHTEMREKATDVPMAHHRELVA
jgi:hypothetical protein